MIDLKNYTQVARYRCGIFRNVDILYCPSCAALWALRVKNDIRYFCSLQGILDYAKEKGLLKAEDLPQIKEELTAYERILDDRYFGRPEFPERLRGMETRHV